MKTLTTKLRIGCIGLTVLGACMSAGTAYAQDAGQSTETVTVRKTASKQESVGVVTGLAIGAAAGGPVGAIIGAARRGTDDGSHRSTGSHHRCRGGRLDWRSLPQAGGGSSGNGGQPGKDRG